MRYGNQKYIKKYIIIPTLMILILSLCGCKGCNQEAEEDAVVGPVTDKLKQFEEMLIAEDTAEAERLREEELKKAEEPDKGFFELNGIETDVEVEKPFIVDTYTSKGHKIKVRVSFDPVEEFKSEEGFKMMEGYRWIVITRRATVEEEYWDTCEEDGSWYLRGLVYDAYTGRKIPYESISVYNRQTITRKTMSVVQYKNLSKDVVAIKEIKYDADKKTMVVIYTLQVPLDYDGITVLTAPQPDDETDKTDDMAESMDPLDVNEQYHFFRVK